MSWGGAVAAMISSIKNNTLAKRTKVFDKEIKAGFSNAPTYEKKVSKEEMDSIKATIQNRATKRRKRELLGVFLSILIAVLVIGILSIIAYRFLSKY